MGRLIVTLAGANNYEKELFRRERHQGDRWFRANIPIPKNTPKGYKVRGVFIPTYFALQIMKWPILNYSSLICYSDLC